MKKYILYITTNLKNNKIYIGIHGTEDPYKFDGYLGCGVTILDRHTYMFPKTPFLYAVKKYGPKNFIRKTLMVFATREEAFELESLIVNEEFIKRADTYNAALGGKCPPISSKMVYLYTLEGRLIGKFPSITEAARGLKMRPSNIGAAIFNLRPSKGFFWTDYYSELLDITNFKIDSNKQTTYLYDAEGKYIKEFVSVVECAKYLQIRPSNCTKAVLGKYKVHGYYVSYIRYDVFPIPDKLNNINRPIYQYAMDGSFIREWPNYKAIKETFGKSINVFEAMRIGGSCGGYQWSATKVPFMKNLITFPLKSHKRKVGKYSLDGELILTFESVVAAKKDTCGAPNVLRGKRKTAGGYIWKYI